MTWLLLLALLQGPPAEHTPAQLERELDAYRRILLDWGGLTRYGSDNYELKRPPDVVFLGDEITEKWPEFFPGKNYVNRGITRQTAAQMLVRFRQDVIGLKPKAVIIQTGANDIASVMGPSTEPTIADHVESMVELATLHGIRVILASVSPVCDCTVSQTKRRSPVKILSLNRYLKDLAARKALVYLDYFSVLAEGRTMKKEFTSDGLLPNAAGYARMAAAAEEAIAKALAKP